MASSKEYLNYVSDQLSELDGITFKPMMGEYILYYRGKAVGGIYDDRFLLKPTPAAKAALPDAPSEIPYPGAKPMLAADVDDRAMLNMIIPAIADEVK